MEDGGDQLPQHWYLVTPDGDISEIPDSDRPSAVLADAPAGSSIILSDSIEGARARVREPEGPPPDALRWILVQPPDEVAIIVVVVDDSKDDQLATAFSEENMVPSDRFGGLWTHWTDEELVSFA